MPEPKNNLQRGNYSAILSKINLTFKATEAMIACFMERLNQQKFIVAAHEETHKTVAEQLGGEVSKISIKPEGNVLGYVLVSFKRLPFRQALEAMMATCAAGFIGEEKIGHTDHSGCGSDLSKLDYLANLASRFLGQGKLSAAHFKEQAFARARSLTPDFSTLSFKAQNLVRQEAMV